MSPEQKEEMLRGVEPVAYVVYAVLGGKSVPADAKLIGGKDAADWRSDDGCHGDYWSGNEPLYTKAALEQAVAAARKAALEEAAGICDAIAEDKYDQYKGRGKHAPNNPQRADTYTDGESDGASECASKIRATNQE